MPGMAAQQAQKREAGTSSKQQTSQKGQKSPAQRLHDLPRTAGVAAMVLLVVLALPVGNFRALQNATPKAFLRQGDVSSIVEDRVSAASNALSVARRASLDSDTFTAVETAMAQLSKAKTAQEISRANQLLTTAVSEMTVAASAKLSGEDGAMLTRAVDNFTEQGSFLRQEARSYNEQAKRAEQLYERLPTKFLLPQPDVYEGI